MTVSRDEEEVSLCIHMHQKPIFSSHCSISNILNYGLEFYFSCSYIKDYDGGILMECHIDPKLPYTDLSTMIRRQRLVQQFGALSIDKFSWALILGSRCLLSHVNYMLKKLQLTFIYLIARQLMKRSGSSQIVILFTLGSIFRRYTVYSCSGSKVQECA